MPLDKIENINKSPTLYWKNINGREFYYDITNEDKETLYKSCAYEGAPQHAVCWTLIQRFAFIYPKFKTLDEFLKAYVQPINPEWFPDGNKHISYCNRLKNAYSGTELEIKLKDANQRAFNRLKQTNAIIKNQKYINIVNDIFNFITSSPNKSMVHYCASFANAKDTELIAKQKAIMFGLKRNMLLIDFGQSFLPGTNWFFAVTKSKNFKVSIL